MSQTADADVGDLVELRKQVDEGKKREADSNQARANAEREAATAKQQVEQAIHERVGETEAAVAQALALAESEAENYKASLERAYADADFKTAAELSLKAGSVSFRRDQLVAKQQEIATWKDNVRRQAVERQNKPAAAQDPLATFSEPTREWIRAHPQVMSDQRIGAKVKAYSIEAEERGIAPDTPEYFAYVEERVGWRKTQQQEEEVSADADALSGASEVTIAGNDEVQQPAVQAQTRLQRPAPSGAAAAPSRGNGQGQQRQPKTTIQLTAEERDIASRQTTLGDTPEARIKQFAINKADLIREGRMIPTS